MMCDNFSFKVGDFVIGREDNYANGVGKGWIGIVTRLERSDGGVYDPELMTVEYRETYKHAGHLYLFTTCFRSRFEKYVDAGKVFLPIRPVTIEEVRIHNDSMSLEYLWENIL